MDSTPPQPSPRPPHFWLQVITAGWLLGVGGYVWVIEGRFPGLVMLALSTALYATRNIP